MIVWNNSLKKIFLWGNNQNGQIDIFKKHIEYKTPKIIFLERSIENFKIIARGDFTGILIDKSINYKNLDMKPQLKEDVFEIINRLSSTPKNTLIYR